MPMLSREAIDALGFLSVGENVQLSDRASFYGVSRIALGNNIRIDDFCVISAGIGGVEIGNHVHIAVGATLIGAGKITLCDFVGVSSKASIYSSNDDYSGGVMTGPTVPVAFTNVRHADVYMGKHVLVGSGSIVLPGVTLEEGVAVGALSLINRDCKAFGIYAGNPARRIKERKRDLLVLERRLMASKAKIGDD